MDIKNPVRVRGQQGQHHIKAELNGRERWIPEDENNMDYAELKKMEREGKIQIKEAQDER